MGGVYFSVTAFLLPLTAGNERTNVSQNSQVVITSPIGSCGRVPMAHFAYSTSKAAVTQMAKKMPTAFIKHRTRFNVIALGCDISKQIRGVRCWYWADNIAVYPSETTESISKSSEKLTPEEYVLRISPLGRAGNTEDMVGCILWLAQRQAHGCQGILL